MVVSPSAREVSVGLDNRRELFSNITNRYVMSTVISLGHHKQIINCEYIVPLPIFFIRTPLLGSILFDEMLVRDEKVHHNSNAPVAENATFLDISPTGFDAQNIPKRTLEHCQLLNEIFSNTENGI
jgi:hypothetical protein